MVVNTCDFNIWKKLRQKEDCEFEASMGYTVKILFVYTYDFMDLYKICDPQMR